METKQKQNNNNSKNQLKKKIEFVLKRGQPKMEKDRHHYLTWSWKKKCRSLQTQVKKYQEMVKMTTA